MNAPSSTLLSPAAALAAGLLLAPVAAAQVPSLLPYHRTADLLIGDAANGVVLRARDLAGTGSYAVPGSLSIYFDPTVALDPASGLPYGPILGVPKVITADLKGTVYVVGQGGQGSPVRVFRLRDLDGNGDANGPGESSIYLDGSLVPIFGNAEVNGAAFDANGALWLTADALYNDFVVKFTDGNHDGDVNDLGEATIVYDDAAAANAGNPPLFNVAWAGFTKDGKFFMTNAAPFHRFTVILEDNSSPPNGLLHDAGDVTIIYQSQAQNPAQGIARCARFGVDGRLYIYNLQSRHFIAAEDKNGNGIFDNAGEALLYFVSGDQGIDLGSGTVFDVRGDGAIVFADSGADAKLVVLQDLTGNGDARGAFESRVDLVFASSAFPTAQPRAVYFLPEVPEKYGIGTWTSAGAPLTLDWDSESGLPYPGNQGFHVQLTYGAPFSTVGLLYSENSASIALHPYAPGIVDPNAVLYVDIFAMDAGALDPGVATSASGSALVPLPLPPSLAPLAGRTYWLQGVSVDFALQAPVVLSNGLTIPLL